eukprot:CAMPEP_0198737726 /NCGR_PEP_ID=MMETSP1475-20131203/68015_1 /TAXON_ID= ORGANISM="Unidentified sp., Strain CCMP1999" /NCGR_SAMPLE_ID=MMETSP1475 /ASSEMBLY_ACC=CAM_ASM_001111 /LENGTH=92 /DNA_ID=CAMNT_0044501595 /DNA_START=1244 /DNA_END=1522 /DNA_ORIENTATION=+
MKATGGYGPPSAPLLSNISETPAEICTTTPETLSRLGSIEATIPPDDAPKTKSGMPCRSLEATVSLMAAAMRPRSLDPGLQHRRVEDTASGK